MNTNQLLKLFLILPLIFTSIALQAQRAKLNLRILDENGTETPARVQINDGDQNFFIAEDALITGGDCDMSDAGAGLTDMESVLNLFSKEIANPYFNSTQFYSDGSSTLTQLPDTVYIMVFRGSEFSIFMGTLSLNSDSITRHTIKLSRWTNMRVSALVITNGEVDHAG